MEGWTTRTSTGWVVSALAGAVLLTACGGLGSPVGSPQARAWAKGPVRWLLLPAEQRELRQLRSDAEFAVFRREFWRRRDPDPGTPDNRAHELFLERVEAADRAYGEEGVRGSLTDPGRAQVLLGPPPLIRHGTRNAPAWRHAASGAEPMPVRRVVVEEWVYGVRDLPPALVALLEERGESGVELQFESGEERTRLVEGEEYLELAAQAWVRLSPAPHDGDGARPREHHERERREVPDGVTASGSGER